MAKRRTRAKKSARTKPGTRKRPKRTTTRRAQTKKTRKATKTKPPRRAARKAAAPGLAGAPADRRIAQKRGLLVEQVSRLREIRGLTNASFAKISRGKLLRAVNRIEIYDLPRAREAFRLMAQKDDGGTVRPLGLNNAVRQLTSARGRTVVAARAAGLPAGGPMRASRLVAPPPTAGLAPAGAGWVALGPGNIGGRTRGIVVHPSTPATMWAASSGGGVWRTDNAGTSWQPVDDFMANLATCSLVIDPTDPNRLYAGTGEGFSNVDALRGAGIFRTADGLSWQQIPSTAGPNFHYVNRLAISRDGSVLLAATPNGIFRSADGDRATWEATLAEAIADVDFHPSSANHAIAGGLNNGRAYFSTDGGRTWSAAAHPGVWSGRVEVTYALNNPDIVYASVNVNGGEVWRSIDGGRTYSRRSSLRPDGAPARYLGDQGWYDNVIWAGDPTNANFVLAGGIDLWRSTDGGNTLADISTWWDPRSAHADHHCIVGHPGFNGTTNRRAFFGCDGGIYTTADVRSVGNNAQPPRINGWVELVNTYSVTQFYGGAGNSTSGVIIGGAQDNGTIAWHPAAGSEQWRQIFGGDGGWCAADPTDPNVFYGEYVFLNVHRNMDGATTDDLDGNRYISGQFWNESLRRWDWKPIPFTIPDAKNQRALFIAPFVLDPNEPSRLLAGGVSLWRTDDAKTPNTPASGPAWSAIKPSAGPPISAIAIAKGDSNIVWVGHTDGQVFRTTNGVAASPVWQRADHTGPSPLTPQRYCTGITIDPANAQVVYVTFGGYVTGNVWKTTDGGQTWTDISGTLPEAPARALAVHPRRTEFVYVGTEVGVFASEDGGATWSPTNEGPTNCSVDDLFWMDERLVAVTHGRGMFEIDLSGV
jgi:photosystem II stability/assembly factor-like uncharacterized protein